MGWFEWLKGKTGTPADKRLREWRTAWRAAAAAPESKHTLSLRAQLEELGLPEEEVEVEREMLDGLERLVELITNSARDGLPTVTTGHRIVGADVCHFSAPASMPDDPAQPSGRLILTNSRALFVGGAKGVTLRWHALAEPIHVERDVLLARADGEMAHRFRCNSFADAMTAAFVARQLAGKKRGHPPFSI
jgi:hypothetical protein